MFIPLSFREPSPPAPRRNLVNIYVMATASVGASDPRAVVSDDTNRRIDEVRSGGHRLAPTSPISRVIWALVSSPRNHVSPRASPRCFSRGRLSQFVLLDVV